LPLTKNLMLKKGQLQNSLLIRVILSFHMTFDSNESEVITVGTKSCLSYIMFNDIKRKEITAEWPLFNRQEMTNAKYQNCLNIENNF
jgi:hypothetical protein